MLKAWAHSMTSLPTWAETTSFPGYSLYFEKVPWLRLVTCLSMPTQAAPRASSETQGKLVETGKSLNGPGKKIARRKVKNENRSPWDSTLNRPVPKPFKILACDWAQKYFCAQSESSSFRVTFVTSYSKVFTAKPFDRLFAIYLLGRAGEFPSIEKCH